MFKGQLFFALALTAFVAWVAANASIIAATVLAMRP